MEVNELKSQLVRFGIRPDKRLGQNFLLSEEVLDQIIDAAELNSGDTVLEVGPGLGVLTRRLADKAGEVIAVEKDRKIYAALRKMFKNKKNVRIVEGDALFLDYSVIASHQTKQSHGHEIAAARTGGPRNDTHAYKLVANIPYYITGKLLQNFLGGGTPSNSLFAKEGEFPLFSKERVRVSSVFPPSLMVLLLQKEVAERIVARPGKMSILSVSVQFYAGPEIISYVSRENFYPIPEVDSAIVRLRVLPRARFDVDERKFFQLVKTGFSNKRKQLQNNLASIDFHEFREASFNKFHMETGNKLKLIETNRNLSWKEVLGSLSLNPLCRAQDLSLEDWKKLYHQLFDKSD